jgi:uncharacterized membrane protein
LEATHNTFFKEAQMRSMERIFLGAAMAGVLAGTAAHLAKADQDPQATPQKMTVVPCYGLNACKGKGECGSKTDGNGCGGSNACKGQGWLSMPKKSCLAAGGSLDPVKKDEK